MRVLNAVIGRIVIPALILISVAAIFSVQMELIENYDFSLTPRAINEYISAFGRYDKLLSGTIATIVAYIALKNYQTAIISMTMQNKLNYFDEWKNIINLSTEPYEESDPYMIREINRSRWSIFEYLHENDFKILSREQLNTFINSFFGEYMEKFEEQNKNYKCNGFYPNDKFSYSFDAFRFILFSTLKDWYPSMIDDLEKMYIENLSVNRPVNYKMYKEGLNKKR